MNRPLLQFCINRRLILGNSLLSQKVSHLHCPRQYKVRKKTCKLGKNKHNLERKQGRDVSLMRQQGGGGDRQSTVYKPQIQKQQKVLPECEDFVQQQDRSRGAEGFGSRWWQNKFIKFYCTVYNSQKFRNQRVPGLQGGMILIPNPFL